MTRVIDAAAGRIAPWRRADRRVLLVEGLVLVLAGGYLLIDGERAEFILGLIVGAALLIDGLRQWILGFRHLEHGRKRDLALIRGSVGIVTGGLVLLLSLLQQITVVGVRLAIGLGGLGYGILGLLLVVPDVRGRQANWTAAAIDAFLVVLALLLFYRVATADSISGLLAVTSWMVIASGILIGAVGIARRPAATPASEPPA